MKKEEIINQASKIIIEYGYMNCTMDNLAKNINTSKKALYLHFNTEEELIPDVFYLMLENLELKLSKKIEQIDNPIIQLIVTYNTIIEYLFAFENTLFFEWIKNHHMKNFISTHLNQYLTSIINPLANKAEQKCYIKPKIKSEMMAEFFNNMIYVLIFNAQNIENIDKKKLRRKIILISINCFLRSTYINSYDEIINNL